MRKLKFLTLAALVVFPLWACDEGEETVAPPPTGTITGTVTIDGTGASGVTVTLSDGTSTSTGSAGSYSFSNVAAGAYTVTISGYASDATFASTTQAATISTAGQVVTVDFPGSYIRTSSIVGAVSGGGIGLASVSVALSGSSTGSTTTDTGGQYSFTGLRAGSYTVTISGAALSGFSFASTSTQATLGAGESKVVSFSGTPVAEATISGAMYLDENDKNDTFDGVSLEDFLEVANVSITLEGPEIGDTTIAQTDATGAFSFTDLEAGYYNVTIASDDADIPSNVEYGRASPTFTLTITAGSSNTVYFPFDIIAQTVKVYAFLGIDEDNPGVAPVEGATISLYPTEEDAFNGTNAFDTEDTDENGEVEFTFDREDDTSPGGGNDHIVFATLDAVPGWHWANGETRLEIDYDPKSAVAMAPDTFDMQNRRVNLRWMGKTVVTGDPLDNWKTRHFSDTTAAPDVNTNFDEDGYATTQITSSIPDIPATHYFQLSPSQPKANGHDWSQTPTANASGSVVGSYLAFTNDGLTSITDTVDFGSIEVAYLDAEVIAYVHHELDDVGDGDMPLFTAGDNWAGVQGVRVTMAEIEDDGDTVDVVSVDATGGTGLVAFGQFFDTDKTWVMKAASKVAEKTVLEATIVDVPSMDGSAQEVEVCPLEDADEEQCSTFAYKFNNNIIRGEILAQDGTKIVDLRVLVTPGPNHIQPQFTDTVVVTNSNGKFNVLNVHEGEYMAMPYDSVQDDGDSIWAFDGAADTVDAEGNAIIVRPDFTGYRMDTEIQGVVVNDRDNDDNVIDPGEAFEGAIIELYEGDDPDDGELIATDTTDSSGAFSFGPLREGEYTVQRVSSAEATILRGIADYSVTVTTAATSTGIGADNTRRVGTTTPLPLPRWDYDNSDVDDGDPTHFTFLYNSGTVRGRVIEDDDLDTPVEGITVSLRRCDVSAGATSPATPVGGGCTTYMTGSPNNMVTNASGEFEYTGLQEGVYEVVVSPTTQGYTTDVTGAVLFIIDGANDVEAFMDDVTANNNFEVS